MSISLQVRLLIKQSASDAQINSQKWTQTHSTPLHVRQTARVINLIAG
jgi:hypothetical protein